MPHMDHSGSTLEAHAGTDYSDFEYLQFEIAPPLNNAGNDSNSFLFEFDPLGQIGGLDNNEVAELVYHEITASVEFEDEAADQDVGTAAELRGLVGANINTDNGIAALGADIGSSIGDGGSDQANDDRIFQLFVARGIPPFDDQTNGPGGGDTGSVNIFEKAWRMLTGRGPVLDASDNIGLSGNLVVGDQLAGITTATVRGHMIFDVAQTSDAGRAFSVPDST